MFTSIDKAIVAAIMAVLGILQMGFGWELPWMNEQLVTALVMGLTPLVVYVFPNKKNTAASTGLPYVKPNGDRLVGRVVR